MYDTEAFIFINDSSFQIFTHIIFIHCYLSLQICFLYNITFFPVCFDSSASQFNGLKKQTSGYCLLQSLYASVHISSFCSILLVLHIFLSLLATFYSMGNTVHFCYSWAHSGVLKLS